MGFPNSFLNESKPVTISITDLYGDTLSAEFTFKIKLSAEDVFRQDKLLREYLSGDPKNASENTYAVAFMLAAINTRIVSSPPLWTSLMSGPKPSVAFFQAVYPEAIKPEQDLIDAVAKKALANQAKLRDAKHKDEEQDQAS